MGNQAAGVPQACIIALLNGVPIDSDQRGKFIGLNFGSNMTISSGADGLLNVDGAAAVTPGAPDQSLQFNNGGVFAGHPTFIRSGDGIQGSDLSFLAFLTAGSALATEGLVRGDRVLSPLYMVRDAGNTANIAALWRFGDMLVVGGDHGGTRRADVTRLECTTSIDFSRAGSVKQQVDTTGTLFVFPTRLSDGQYHQFGTTNPATAGDVRLRNVASMQFRDSANTANLNALATSATDNVFLGTDSAFTNANQATGVSIYCKAAGTIAIGRGGSTYAYLQAAEVEVWEPLTGSSTGSSPYGAHGGVSHTFAADANYVVTAAQYKYTRLIFETGVITLGRTVTFPAPSSEARGYWKRVRNNTNQTLTISTGVGATVALLTLTGANLWFGADGVTLMSAAL